VQLVYLLTTAAAFDVWERQHEGRGEEGGNRRNGLATHSTWPFMPVKTRPRPQGTKLVSDAADACQLLDDGRRVGCGGDDR